MITQARQELKEALEETMGKCPVYPFPPERLESPAVIIDTAPIVTSGDTYGSWNIGFKITLIAERAGDVSLEISSLDTLLSRLLPALEHTEISSGDHFGAQAADGQTFLAYELISTTNYRKEKHDLQKF